MSKKYDYVFKILTLGESSVGKSCLLLRFCDNTFDSSHVTTVGIDFKTKICHIGDSVIKLQVWDTSGQERFKTVTKNYYKGGDGILLVYDITDRESFDSMKNWIKQIEMHAKPTAFKILVGNKCDLINERKVTYEEGYELAQEFKINFFESSAKDNTNVVEVFDSLTKQILDLAKQNQQNDLADQTIDDKKIPSESMKERNNSKGGRKCCN